MFYAFFTHLLKYHFEVASNRSAYCPLLKEVPLKTPSATASFPFSAMQHETEHMKLVLYLSRLNGIVFMIFNYAFNIVANFEKNTIGDFVFRPLLVITNNFVLNSKLNLENTIINMHTNLWKYEN